MKAVTVGMFLERSKTPYGAVTVHRDASLREILDTMLRHGEERAVFVVDDAGALAGVVSLGALARHVMHEGIAPQNGFSPATDILHYLTAENAADIMETEVVCCSLDDPLEDVRQKMLSRKVYKVLPVVDASYRIIGALNLIALLEASLAEE
jgi:CBS domain-containing protein